jgi:hypothetical protein
MEPRVRWRERLGVTADVLQVASWIGLSTLGVALGIVFGTGGGSDNAGPSPSPLVTSQPVTTQPVTSQPTATSGTSSAVPVAQRTLLQELAKADSSGSPIDLRFRDVDINGERYQNSLHYHCELYCDGPSPATYEVDLGRRFARFETVAGVVDTAAGDANAKFEIDVDDKHYTFDATLGRSQPVNIEVKGALRLRIRMYAPATLKSPLQAGADAAGGKKSVLPDSALGHPVLVP